MGFWRELKDGLKMQTDIISFGLGRESSIGYNAFLRNESAFGKDDYSLAGDLIGRMTGSAADLFTVFMLPVSLYAYQKNKSKLSSD